MPTNNEIIQDALTDIAIVSAGVTATATQLSDGLTRLNRMMAEWAENDVNLGFFPQSAGTDTIPIPIWAERAVETNLAMNLATFHRVPVTQELATEALTSYTKLANRCISEKIEPLDMDHLPGGGRTYRYNIESDV